MKALKFIYGLEEMQAPLSAELHHVDVTPATSIERCFSVITSASFHCMCVGGNL